MKNIVKKRWGPLKKSGKFKNVREKHYGPSKSIYDSYSKVAGGQCLADTPAKPYLSLYFDDAKNSFTYTFSEYI